MLTIIDKNNTIKDILPNITILGQYSYKHGLQNRIRCICKCRIHNNKFESDWSNLSKGKGCPICGTEKRIQKRIIPLEEKQKKVTKLNPNIILISKIRETTKYNCKCLIDNHEWAATWGSLLSGYGCPECKRRNVTGENSPTWNSNITSEEREIKRNYSNYRNFIKATMERDNYTCQVTGKRGCRLVVHHLNGYNWFKEGRTDINNAITVSYKVHNEFHKIYGKGNNTKEQFEEFINNYKNIIKAS